MACAARERVINFGSTDRFPILSADPLGLTVAAELLIRTSVVEEVGLTDDRVGLTEFVSGCYAQLGENDRRSQRSRVERIGRFQDQISVYGAIAGRPTAGRPRDVRSESR
jgi:hypothetical protein